MKKVAVSVIIMCMATMLNANQPDIAGMERPVRWIEAALKTRNEALFRTHWHPAGYMESLAGPEGLSGQEMFSIWGESKWFLRHVPAELQQDGRAGAYILYCEIWSADQDEALGSLWVLPVYLSEKKIWAILAVSEDYDAVLALSRLRMIR